ncbi:MAG: FkbM family methyltransferase [Cyanobacteria bacterium J06581_3]
MKKTHPLLVQTKRIASNPTINPLVRKTIRLFSKNLSDDFLSRIPIVGNVKIDLDLNDVEDFLFFSKGDDHIISRQYLSPSGFERPSMNLFIQLAKQSEVVFDIGANTGIYSIASAVNSPQASIYAFEPVPKILDRLNHNIKINHLENVKSQAYLITNRNGTQALHIPYSKDIVTSASAAKGFRECAETIDVPSSTLDTFVESHKLSSVDLIKIDTESTEPAVLQGATNTIERLRPTILCEVLHGLTEVDLHSCLDKSAYRYFWVTPEGLVEKQTIVGDRTYKHLNYLFVSANKVKTIEKFLAK